MFRFPFSLIALLGALQLASQLTAEQPSRNELNAVKDWIARRFANASSTIARRGSLAVKVKGGILKNHATTKVYHKNLGALPLRIGKQQFQRIAEPGHCRRATIDDSSIARVSMPDLMKPACSKNSR